MNKLFLLFGFLGLIATSAFGSAITPSNTPCTTGTIETYDTLYTAANGGCTVDGVAFYNFSLLTAYDSGGVSIDPSTRFTISPSTDGAPGFLVTFAGTTSDVIEYDIQYSFDPPPAIGSASLHLDVEGSVQVTEGVCPAGVFTAGPDSATSCNDNGLDPPAVILGVSNEPGDTSAFATFTPVSQGQIRLLFTLDGTTSAGPAGFDSLSSDVGTAPEPTSIALLLVGCVGIGIYKRKVRR